MPSLPPFEKSADWMMFRIHKNPKDKEYQTFCERQFDSFISCYETHSNRPHVHILVKIKVSRSVQISKLMKKMFGFQGNTDFSVKNVNPEGDNLQEVCKYVCKGDAKNTLPCVVFKSLDWDEKKIKELHEEYWKVQRIETFIEPQNNVIKVDLNQIEIEPKKKIKRKNWTEKIIEELISDYVETDWDWHNEKHKDFMIEYVLRKLGDTKKIFDEYQVKKFVYACFNSLDAKNFRSNMTAKVKGIL